MTKRRIGKIGNYYGSLEVFTKDGRFYWSIEDYSGEDNFEEIPEYVYQALSKFQDSTEESK